MADPQIVGTLETKSLEIGTYIAKLEKRLAQARADLQHVNACIRLFQIGPTTTQFPVYVKLGRLFQRNELPELIRRALRAAPDGSLDTRELALAITAAKGWDASDKALAVSVGAKLVPTLSERRRRHGDFVSVGKRDGVNVWSLVSV